MAVSTMLPKLKRYREIQTSGLNNYCFASAKFFAGKLVGLFAQNKTLMDFYRSLWFKSVALYLHRRDAELLRDSKWIGTKGRELAQIRRDGGPTQKWKRPGVTGGLRRHWSHRSSNPYFNQPGWTLDAAVNNPKAGVQAGAVKQKVEFVWPVSDLAEAEKKLKNGVPLVIAQDLKHAAQYISGIDHFVTLVYDAKTKKTWTVDPYRYTGVYELKYGLRTRNTTFTRVGPHDVRLPPLLRHRLLGYYRTLSGKDLTVGSSWK